MSANIYVGNLSYEVSESELNEMFGEFGEVVSAKVISDQASGRSKGFGFVEMADKESAQKAIEALNGKEIKGRAMKVNEAHDKGDRKGKGGPGGRGGGGNRGGRSGGGGGMGGQGRGRGRGRERGPGL